MRMAGSLARIALTLYSAMKPVKTSFIFLNNLIPYLGLPKYEGVRGKMASGFYMFDPNGKIVRGNIVMLSPSPD